MRIAEVSCFSKFSVGKIMQSIKTYINDNTSDTCEIFYARLRTCNSGVYFGNKMLIYCNAFISRIFDNDGLLPSYITLKLIQELNQFRPDIVHIHCLHGYYLNIKKFFEYLNNKNIKVVWTMHDAWAITGHCCYFSLEKCFKRKSGCFSCPLKKSYPSSLAFDNSKRNYSIKKRYFNLLSKNKLTVVTPSNWLTDIIKESYLNKYEVRTIYNGIDLTNFKKIELNKKSDKKIILGVASVWDERKGLNKFIELSNFLNSDWEILLVGKFLENYKLPGNIKHIERTDNQNELVEVYNKSTILFNPTLDDNYPTVNLEAQASGLKVLSYDTGGSLETDCGNLYACEETSSEDIFELIKKIDTYELNEINYDKLDFNRMSREYYNLFNSITR